MEKHTKVGYVLEQFPKLSETFVLEEMLELERLGLDLTIFALSDPKESQVHEKVENLRAETIRPVTARPWRALRRRAEGPRLQTIHTVGPKKWFWGVRMSSWLAGEAEKRSKEGRGFPSFDFHSPHFLSFSASFSQISAGVQAGTAVL